MTRRRIAHREPQEPGEPLLTMAGVSLLPGSISCAPGPGRVHGDRPRLSMTRRPKKDAPRSVGNRCGARFLAPFLTRRAEDERCRGSPADRAGVSKERPSGRGDAGGHWMPAERSTSRLGAPQAGAPWGASWLSAGRTAATSRQPRRGHSGTGFSRKNPSRAPGTIRHRLGGPRRGNSRGAETNRSPRRGDEGMGRGFRRQRENGSAGNAASSRSDSASSTPSSRMVVSASRATSRVSSLAWSVLSRSRARSHWLRASAVRPR